ncbi:MAG: DUF6448 family protein [Desulfobulbaceae bacterium]|nr:DUF6448 family protein [Desulfobulbaceae bacterium]HIJ79216.1 hypothetical protein [Deltaproteobacteria bacterium]
MNIYKSIPAGLLFALLSLVIAANASAHCDTLDGPVVVDARTALAQGDVTPLLKWVRADQENEIKAAYERTMAVRAKGGEAKELADMYFFETLVRIHRAGEGAPYTGLKPGNSVDPAVAMADKALKSGNIDRLVSVLTTAMAKGIHERFQHALEAQKDADKSVDAGREFVEAYVVFTHYVEGMHGQVKACGAHQGEGGH